MNFVPYHKVCTIYIIICNVRGKYVRVNERNVSEKFELILYSVAGFAWSKNSFFF